MSTRPVSEDTGKNGVDGISRRAFLATSAVGAGAAAAAGKPKVASARNEGPRPARLDELKSDNPHGGQLVAHALKREGVSAKWNPQLEGIYRSIGDLIGIELDLERIKQARPKIAELLREKAEKDTNKRSDASVPPLGSWRRLPDMPVPRWEAGAIVFDDKLYVLGGYEMPTKACKRADVFDPKDNSWRRLADLPSAVTHINLHSRCSLREHNVRFAERTTTITVLDRAV